MLRSADSLESTAVTLGELGAQRSSAWTDAWEATNLLTVASALVAAATGREETRGCHWREDYPLAREEWLGHLLARIKPDNELDETWEPV